MDLISHVKGALIKELLDHKTTSTPPRGVQGLDWTYTFSSLEKGQTQGKRKAGMQTYFLRGESSSVAGRWGNVYVFWHVILRKPRGRPEVPTVWKVVLGRAAAFIQNTSEVGGHCICTRHHTGQHVSTWTKTHIYTREKKQNTCTNFPLECVSPRLIGCCIHVHRRQSGFLCLLLPTHLEPAHRPWFFR